MRTNDFLEPLVRTLVLCVVGVNLSEMRLKVFTNGHFEIKEHIIAIQPVTIT